MDTAIHAGNIVLSICGIKLDSQLVKSRLSVFYGVAPDKIMHSSSASIDTYFIAESQNAYQIDWFYKDEVSFTASVYPVIDADVLGVQREKRGGKSIKNLVNRGKGELPDMWKMRPPFALFYHHIINDTLVCYNDFLGYGKIYHYNAGGGSFYASSPLAIALIVSDELKDDENFWSAYYTFGCGMGSRTYYKGVSLLDGGSKITYAKNKCVIQDLYSYTKLLSLQKDNLLSFENPIDVSKEMMFLVKDYLPENLRIGVSGGRDSRFIAALAISLDLDFTAYTAYPPVMEAEVAERLFRALPRDYGWHKLKSEFATHVPKTPILERAQKWFEYQSGESWSTSVRTDFNITKLTSDFSMLSGASGEIVRAQHYNHEHLANPVKRVDAVMNSKKKARLMLPQHIKNDAFEQYKSELFNPLSCGIDGLYLLDFSFFLTNIRRYDAIFTKGVKPIFNPQMIVQTFWQSLENKITAKYLVDSTNELVPQWKNIKYMHELTEGTDPSVTNKTHTVPTFWEIDRDDFFDSIRYVIDNFNSAELTMDQVEKNIRELPEGRPRTARTYEFMFWRAGFKQTNDKINLIRKLLR